MREKYESLAAGVLRDIAKSRGIKGTSTMRKSQLVEAMLEEDERLKSQETPEQKTVEPRPAEQRPVEQRQEGGQTGRPMRHEGERAAEENKELDSGIQANGILEVMPDGHIVAQPVGVLAEGALSAASAGHELPGYILFRACVLFHHLSSIRASTSAIFP